MIITLFTLGIIIACTCWLRSATSTIHYPPLDTIVDVDDIVQAYLDQEHTHALSIGIYQAGAHEFYNYGAISDENPSSPDSLSLYEIGSITKTMTAALLNLAVEAGKVNLDDPIRKYLPDSLCNWEENVAITLEELATHTSGLPRIPSNMMASMLANMDNPYKNYSVKQLYKFLKKYKPIAKAKRKMEYSNLGAGLLGHIIALQYDKDYEQLFKTQLAQPLGMNHSTITLENGLADLMVQGHSQGGKAVSNWDLPTLTGAGAIRSNTLDMLKYVEANIKGSLSLDKTHEVRHKLDENNGIGLGWFQQNLKDTDVSFHWHNGGTGGFRTFCAFAKEQAIGVVILSNTAISVDEMGMLILQHLVRED